MGALLLAPTCGRCRHWEMSAQIGIGSCFGAPPTPVVVGMTPQGPHIALLRPNMQSTERACAAFAVRLAPLAEPALDDSTRASAQLVFSPPDGQA